jgi:acyl dehydratase
LSIADVTADANPNAVFNDWSNPVRVRIDAAPVMLFAGALHDQNPIWRSGHAAAAAGFDSVPATPTFTFVMGYSGTFPDLQPEGGTGHMDAPTSKPMSPDGTSATGLYLHGEQHFTYHRQPVVGDVLEGRMRISEPMDKGGSRGRMEITLLETVWRDLDGEPVVTERIVSIFLPDA